MNHGMNTIQYLISISTPPSHFTGMRHNVAAWTSVTECESCGQRGHYEDCHPSNPCRRCGGKTIEKVGKLVEVKTGFFRVKRYWELRHDPAPMPALFEKHIAELNAGIRDTVIFLRANGFDTRDSGDGQTADHKCDLPVPYVHIAVEPHRLAAETLRLMNLLKDKRVCFGNFPNPQEDTEGYLKAPSIEASFDPSQSSEGFIHLFNVKL